jgi:hypothetical protein
VIKLWESLKMLHFFLKIEFMVVNFGHSIDFQENRHFLQVKLDKIAENCAHNSDP